MMGLASGARAPQGARGSASGDAAGKSSVRLVTAQGGLEAVEIATPAAHGLVYVQGAHVADWTPAGFAPVLWMSAHSGYRRGAALRGGIPICFPWFGNGPDGGRQPNHGWARIRPWDFVDHRLDPDGTAHLTFELEGPAVAPDPRDAAKPGGTGLRLRLEVSLGTSLELSLRVQNRTGEPVRVERAMHAYWAVGDVRRVRVEGLDASAFVDRTRGGAGAAPSPFPALTGQTLDRLYPMPSRLVLRDPVARRSIHIGGRGVAQTVAWNPGAQGARAMGDFGDDEWMRMLCLEACDVRERAATLAPGEAQTMTMRVDVERAAGAGASRPAADEEQR